MTKWHTKVSFEKEKTMNAPAVKIHKPVREQVSAEEWQVRVNLAACYRLMAEYDMVEMIANHISARVPGTHNEFLINPYGMLYEEVTASSLIKIDIDGTVLFNATDYGVNQAGYVIHSAVHSARHDVDCVIHTHTLAGMSVSAHKQGLLPIAQSGAQSRRTRAAGQRPRRRRSHDPAQPWLAHRRRQHRGMLQQPLPPRTRLPVASDDPLVRHRNPVAAGRSGAIHLSQPGQGRRHAPPRRAGMAFIVAEVGS
jgi:hypothetical protein